MTSRSEWRLPLTGFEWTPSEPRPEDGLQFDELKRWELLKRRLKRGPKMTKKERVEYLRRLVKKEWGK
jgi:hypothetical protein